jgi:pyruvate dehydrogenase E2 component (dihydrolipoamide acetyltransferase)
VSKEFKLPELGENISSGDLVRMLVKQGESISEGQPVMELETDKAVIEVPSSVSGKVEDIRVKEGQKVKVGETILIIEDGTNGNRPRTEAKPEAQAPQGSNGQKPQQAQQQQQPPPKQQAQPAQQQAQQAGRQQRAETTPPVSPDEMSTNEQADARVDMQQRRKVEGKSEEQALPPDHPLPNPPAQATPPSATVGTTASGATDFKLPELGENIKSGDLVRLMISAGQQVHEGQPVVELETDKAVIEVPSSVTGKVKDIKVKQGDKVAPGQIIFTLEGGAAPAPEHAKPSTTPVEHLSGQQAARVAFQAAIQAEGKTEEQALPRDRRYGDIEHAREDLPQQLVKSAGTERRPPVPAAPSVRRLARELGVDIYVVTGSGPGGRISEDDIKAYTKQIVTSGAGMGVSKDEVEFFRGHPKLPDFSKWGKVEVVSMRGIRRATAQHMWESWNTVPHVTQHDRADITELEQLRSRFAAKAEQSGGKMTVTAIALKVCASALKVFPHVNASIDMAKEEVIYKQYINIGVAVDTEHGLLVPVIKDVDKKNIIELAVELTDISKRARDRKLKPEEMEGGTFTITNLGGIGGTSFTPIVNHPEVAILGMSRSSMQPVWMDNEFKPRLVLPLSLSYDHRLVDGADAARFLRWVAEALEQPFLLSVQG